MQFTSDARPSGQRFGFVVAGNNFSTAPQLRPYTNRRPRVPDMAFQPQEPELKQLAGFLKDSLSGYDRERQKNAEQVSRQVDGCRFKRSCAHNPIPRGS